MTPLFCYCLQVNEVIIHVIYWFILLACCNRGRGRRNRLSDVIYSNGQNWMLNFNDSCLSHFNFLLENLVHHCFLLISIIYVRNCRLLLNIILELISLKKMSIKMGPLFSLQAPSQLTWPFCLLCSPIYIYRSTPQPLGRCALVTPTCASLPLELAPCCRILP